MKKVKKSRNNSLQLLFSLMFKIGSLDIPADLRVLILASHDDHVIGLII